MANKVILNGYFGVKQSFHVSDPNVTTGWDEGNLFLIGSIGTSGAGTSKGAVGAAGPFVGLNATSGALIVGVALEGSVEQPTAVAGMLHPSGSKVTLLHGHSSFFLQYLGATTPAGSLGTAAWSAAGIPWEYDVQSTGALMSPLFASANGRFCEWTGGAAVERDTVANPIGYLSQVPSSDNTWTMGVVLFG